MDLDRAAADERPAQSKAIRQVYRQEVNQTGKVTGKPSLPALMDVGPDQAVVDVAHGGHRLRAQG